ncbi:MAG: hypothetical protein EPN74_15615 [Rhodanobacter sp.]|nr:MAG: hypothetical protein EPN74_15615 [Rhodanobacter sp.]
MIGHRRTRRIGVEVSEDEVLAQVRAGLFRHGAPIAGTYCCPGDSAYYVVPQVFRNVLCKGFDADGVARLLGRRCVLRLVNGYGFQHRMTLPSGGVRYMYIIEPEPLGVAGWCIAEQSGAA